MSSVFTFSCVYFVPYVERFRDKSKNSTEWNFDSLFNPTYFVNLDQKHITAKLNAMNFYKTEIHDFPHPRSVQGIETLARYRGMQAGYQFAEAFSIVRILD